MASSTLLQGIYVTVIGMGLVFLSLGILLLAMLALGLFLLTVQADLTPYTAGANDNATGAGIVLSLAERLREEPLAHTLVWAVLSGCEEVGCYGADGFARDHQDELDRAGWISVDSMGSVGARPGYLTSETFLLTTHSDPDLLALAARVTSSHPELDARPFRFSGAYTEGSIGGKYGFRVLTLMAFPDEGVRSEWHRPTDIVPNVDPDTVECSETFAWELLQEIDRQAGKAVGG